MQLGDGKPESSGESGATVKGALSQIGWVASELYGRRTLSDFESAVLASALDNAVAFLSAAIQKNPNLSNDLESAAPAPSGDVSVAEIVSEMRKTVAQATGPGYTGTIFAAVVDRWADALAATNTPPTESVRLEGEVHEFKPSPLSVTQFAPFRSLGAEVVPDDFPIGPVAITITPLGGDDE